MDAADSCPLDSLCTLVSRMIDGSEYKKWKTQIQVPVGDLIGYSVNIQVRGACFKVHIICSKIDVKYS